MLTGESDSDRHTLNLTGFPNEWNALNHLQSWVNKNAKSYFGSDKYLKAEGCVRDGLVTIESVKLGSIDSKVSDGNGSSCAVNLIQGQGRLTATCDCSAIRSAGSDEVVAAENEGDLHTSSPPCADLPVSLCHHLAAFLLYVSSALPKEIALFACGDTDENFSYRGFLTTFKTRAELIELYVQSRSARAAVKMEADFASTLDGGLTSKVIVTTLTEIEAIIDDFEGGEGGDDPWQLSSDLEKPLKKLKPLFKRHPKGVLMILKEVITHLGEVDLEAYEPEDPYENYPDYDPDCHEPPELPDEQGDFDKSTLEEIWVGFILSRPEGTRGEALQELRDHIACEGFHLNWCRTLISHTNAEIGPELLKFLTSTEFMNPVVCGTHDMEKLLARFEDVLPVEQKIRALELAMPSTLTSVNMTEVLVLINLFISTGQPQKAIDWIDSRMGNGGGLCDVTSTSMDKVLDLVFIRAKLAVDVEKDADIQLSWLKKAIRKCRSESVFKDCCELRPDRILDLEAQYFDSHPDAFLLMLDKAGRHGDISALLSTKENLDRFSAASRSTSRYHYSRGYVVHFNIIDYFICSCNSATRVRGVSTTVVEEFLLAELVNEYKTTGKDSYRNCIKLLRVLLAVSPQVGRAEIVKIRSQFKGRRIFIEMLDEAHFAK